MEMRVRILELLGQRGLTPYSLSLKSGNRISLSAAHRLARAEGRVKLFSAELLEALCDVLDVDPGELLEREAPKRRRAR